MNKCLIHYFSGTGNTYHMVNVIKNQLIERGYKVNILNIENDSNKQVIDYELHVFCYPIYGFGTPSIMLRYISNLNHSRGNRAAVICTSAGEEGQALHHFRYLLSKKGFEVLWTEMVTYTHNFTQFLNPKSKEIETQVFRQAEIKITGIINKICKNEGYLKKRNIILLALYWMVFTLFSKLARKLLGRMFIADDSCTSCKKCKKFCPAKAIRMYNGKPKWNLNCESCQRCINICPNKSIQLSIAKLIIFIVAQLSPIFIIIFINENIKSLPFIIDIMLYFAMSALNTFLANILISFTEKFQSLRKILQVSYTKKYRRNIAKGFNI